MLTPQHLTRLGILPDLSVAPERAAQKSSSSGSLREQMLVGTVCFMCLENVCAFGIPHPCSCGREKVGVGPGLLSGSEPYSGFDSEVPTRPAHKAK